MIYIYIYIGARSASQFHFQPSFIFSFNTIPNADLRGAVSSWKLLYSTPNVNNWYVNNKWYGWDEICIYIYTCLFGKYNWTCTLYPQIVPLRMYQEHFALTFFNSTANDQIMWVQLLMLAHWKVSSLVPFSIYQKTNPTRIVNGDMVGIYVSSA